MQKTQTTTRAIFAAILAANEDLTDPNPARPFTVEAGDATTGPEAQAEASAALARDLDRWERHNTHAEGDEPPALWATLRAAVAVAVEHAELCAQLHRHPAPATLTDLADTLEALWEEAEDSPHIQLDAGDSHNLHDGARAARALVQLVGEVADAAHTLRDCAQAWGEAFDRSQWQAWTGTVTGRVTLGPLVVAELGEVAFKVEAHPEAALWDALSARYPSREPGESRANVARVLRDCATEERAVWGDDDDQAEALDRAAALVEQWEYEAAAEELSALSDKTRLNVGATLEESERYG